MKNLFDEKKRLIHANKFLISLRWVYLSSLALTGVISKFLPGIRANTNFTPKWMGSMIFIVFAVNLIWYLYFRHGEKRPLKTIKFISIFQLVFDMTGITCVTYFAGGLTSISFMYHFYPIVASAFLFSFLTTILISLLAVFMYGGVIIFQYFDWLPYLSRYNIPYDALQQYNFSYEAFQAHNPSAVFTNLSAILPGFLIVGIFAGVLAYNNRRREKEIKVERDKEKAIIDNMLDGLLYVNNRGAIEELNPQATKLLNVDAKEVIGKGVHDFDPEKHAILIQVLKFDARTAKELVPRGKSDMVYNINSIETKDEKGSLIGTTIIIHDASQDKFVENMKSEFNNIASNQLRAPLKELKKGLEQMLSGGFGDINHEQNRIIRQSYEHSEKLMHLVGDLLNVSSIEEGEFDYKFERTDLHNLLRGVCDRMATRAENKHLDFGLRILTDLPIVNVDPYKMRLAITSLVDNAINYSEERGKVEVRGITKEDKVLISVQDNGIGIPHNNFNNIFTKFFRAKNAIKKHAGGSGLDLFVAKNIVENHKGKIWFESEEGKGSTFYIEIPMTK